MTNYIISIEKGVIPIFLDFKWKIFLKKFGIETFYVLKGVVSQKTSKVL